MKTAEFEQSLNRNIPGREEFLAELEKLYGELGLARTIEFSTRKGLPFFADDSSPLNADMWEVSITGNLRLSSRRAFEDAFTRRGQMLALVGWLVQELEISKRCQEAGIDYYFDPRLIMSLTSWHENP